MADRVGHHRHHRTEDPDRGAAPSGGPTIVVAQAVDSSRALAVSRSRAGSSAFRYAPEAERKVTSAAATTARPAGAEGR
ncbi:hypothetical protein SGLAM104S_07591 [Streptomyces glaucescens]